MSYFGADGKPCLIKDGYAGRETHFRRAGKQDERVLLRRRRQALRRQERGCRMEGRLRRAGKRRRAGPTSAPTASPARSRTDTPKAKATFDERGNETSHSYFDTDGKPCLIKDGYAKAKATFDERGNKTGALLLRHRRQALPDKDGYAAVKAHLRRAGKQDERVLLRRPTASLPAQGRVRHLEGRLRPAGIPDGRVLLRHRRQPCLYKDRFTSATMTYDERGNQTSVCYFGTDGKPCLCTGRECRMRRPPTTSAETRRAESYFGIDGKPCLIKNGYAEMKVTYDERGNQVSQSYFGTDGKPCLHKDGNAGWKARVRRARKRDKPVLLRHRRQALPVEGRIRRDRGSRTTSGEIRRSGPASAPTASPACTRTAMPK